MKIGFALCGSFCTYADVFPIMEQLAKGNTVIPIFSGNSACVDSRFGHARDFLARAGKITGNAPLLTLADVEPIGPGKLLDILVIAPCTGNTLSKLSHSLADTPVTMAAKSHLRNGGAIVIGISTNDGLAGAAENIGRLLSRKHFYFVPFGQDDPEKKPTSLVADFSRIPQTIEAALHGQQLQPMLL